MHYNSNTILLLHIGTTRVYIRIRFSFHAHGQMCTFAVAKKNSVRLRRVRGVPTGTTHNVIIILQYSRHASAILISHSFRPRRDTKWLSSRAAQYLYAYPFLSVFGLCSDNRYMPRHHHHHHHVYTRTQTPHYIKDLDSPYCCQCKRLFQSYRFIVTVLSRVRVYIKRKL